MFIFFMNHVGIRPQRQEQMQLAWKPEEVTDDGQLDSMQLSMDLWMTLVASKYKTCFTSGYSGTNTIAQHGSNHH